MSFLVSGAFRRFLLIGVISCAGAPQAAEPAADETPLQAGAKRVLAAYSKAKTQEEQAVVRDRLVSMADTLEAAGEDVLATECLERAGIVSYKFAEYDEAVSIWDRGLRIARRSGDRKRIAALLNAQAVGASVMGNEEQALELQAELLVLRREVNDVFGEGVSLHAMGISYLNLFRYPEAIEAMRSALRLLVQTDKAYSIAQSMITLSNALHQVGELDIAIVMADSAVARAPAVDNPSLTGNVFGVRAVQLYHLGRTEEALRDFARAHEELSRGGLRRTAALVDVHWADLLVSLGRCDEARRTIDTAREVVVSVSQAEEQVFADCIRARIEARCGQRQEARRAMQATIDRFEAIRDSIPEALSRANAFRLAGGTYTDLALLEEEDGNTRGAWRIVETGAARVLRQDLGLGGGPMPEDRLSRLQRRLGEIDAIALQYSVAASDRALVFVVTPDSIRAEPLKLSAAFQVQVSRALRLMSSGANDVDCRVALYSLSRAVLAPVAESLHGTRLLVFPGMLSGFPMEVLPLPESGTTLGDQLAVTYAPSATAFLHLERRPARQRNVVVFADPLIPTQPAMDALASMRAARLPLTPLAEARAEGAAIAGRGTLLVGKEASKGAFRAHAAGAGVLHFAAHAVVDASAPEASGVVLAGGTEDDVLTSAEIQDVALGTDLVSLSGCRTAGGYVARGEGAFGLTRAFLTAGARSVVSSWWDVEDKAARRFMELFYDELRDGTDRDIAVQHARQAMAREGFPLRDRAAFALTGATATPVAAVQNSSRSSPIVPILVGALLAGLVFLTMYRVSRR